MRRNHQRTRWHVDVLPRLIRPYMKWMRERSASSERSEPRQHCDCAGPHRVDDVLCVYMSRLEKRQIRHCEEQTLTVQLVECGLFPCAPVRPELAVSMVMLDWASTLFLHMAPNIRAWTTTAEIMLQREGHHFGTASSFRRRFSNSLVHYQLLIRLVDAEMDRMASAIPIPPRLLPGHLREPSSPPSVSNCLPESDMDVDPSHPDPKIPSDLTSSIPSNTSIDAREYRNAHTSPTFSHPDLPSDYLRGRCPCCFGSTSSPTPELSADCIVSFDANFQLKRIKDYDRRPQYRGLNKIGSQDPKMTSPQTIEVPRGYAEMWQSKVAEIREPKRNFRASKGKGNMGSGKDDLSKQNHVTPGLNLTESTYDGCEGSFTAADGERQKASKKYFDETGIMSAVCRHGIPLFYVSVWTPGEQQFYILSLLGKLIEHLPSSWTIGCLYDIGCQTDRALHKWNIAPEWRSRLVWGVSIFHAYGHQWACQLWYHPRKDRVWGLSDGEVCERFWSELRQLIPSLRVAGYHRRLFVLDMQMSHITDTKCLDLGNWLHHHITNAKKRLESAQQALKEQNVDDMLEHFKAQRQYHSKPQARQTKTPVRTKIEAIMGWKATIESSRSLLEDLRCNMPTGSDSVAELLLADWQECVDVLDSSIARLRSSVEKATKELQAKDDTHEELKKAEKDVWANGFLNLRVLRDQLLRKLRARKQELQRLDQSHGGRVADQSLRDHVDKAVSRRSAGVDATLKKYNDKILQLAEMRGRNGVAEDAWLPSPLRKEGLYKLDVDQDIWQDCDPSQFEELPAWLADPCVKEGIPSAQMVVSCQSEIARCEAEHANLRQWIWEESYRAVHLYFAALGSDVDVAFFSLMRIHRLHKLQNRWEGSTKTFEISAGTKDWAPNDPPPSLHAFHSLPEVQALAKHHNPNHSPPVHRVPDDGSVRSDSDESDMFELNGSEEEDEMLARLIEAAEAGGASLD
ncbi:uncharacterized protein EI90DRAFT_2929882 [Cantharellus anzutake]|uniref:uncharacterized protein n=1 Tax=Cantharellus anzutake TaxID=1750568 RepID=UPI0019033EAD|nr:uncharacterized protein EI90DRAFT_2929882 [Cantharellus anzutake]KAF8326594.1 hypothetical protein EI90DRAFT_2929882 [Cantharellus anzutake]